MFYIINVRDSDGNDCTVYDALVQAASRDEAVERVFAEWAEIEYPDDEGDGGYGTDHACDCECEHATYIGPPGVCEKCTDGWECSHGGLLVSEPEEAQEYATEEEARSHLAYYHLLIDLSEAPS